MAKGDGRVGPKRLNLVSTGDAGSYESDSVRLDVLVDATGNLVMDGEDLGPRSDGSSGRTSTNSGAHSKRSIRTGFSSTW